MSAATRGRRLPFVIVPSWLLIAPAVSDRAIRVYGLLAHHADRDTREAFPSRGRLAELAGCSTDSIDRALRELVKAGAIDVLPRRDPSGRSLSSIYVVHEAPSEAEGEGRHGAAPASQGENGGGRHGAALTRTNRATRKTHAREEQDQPQGLRLDHDPDETEARFRRLTGDTN